MKTKVIEVAQPKKFVPLEVTFTLETIKDVQKMYELIGDATFGSDVYQELKNILNY